MHKISNVNETTRMGYCSLCGYVKVKYRGQKVNGDSKWSCRNLIKQHDKIYVSRPHGKRTRWKREVIKASNKLPNDIPIEIFKKNPTHCACCGEPKTKTFHLDHCHKTGKIRDFICSSCNLGLGHFDDSLEKMQKAIKYLERHLNISGV